MVLRWEKGDYNDSNAVRLDANGFNLFENKNDFPEKPARIGRLLAVSLKPGENELYSWKVFVRTFGGHGYIYPRVRPVALPFVVKAGRITYLGSMHLETLMGKNLFGLEIPAGAANLKSVKFSVL